MHGWAAGMPVCTFLDAGASIQAHHLVDSLAAPQTMATSSIARVLHATSAQHGYVNGGYSHTSRHMEGTSSTDRLMPYTRHHALLFGKYSKYAAILNCFSNSLRCLWVSEQLVEQLLHSWCQWRRTGASMLTCNGRVYAQAGICREPIGPAAGWR